jgi:hypothetical protein
LEALKDCTEAMCIHDHVELLTDALHKDDHSRVLHIDDHAFTPMLNC